MFDAQTIREEIAAIETKMKDRHPVDRSYAAKLIRGLREREREEIERETVGRNPVTGY